LTAEKYKNYLKSLTDFELYTLAKKNIITGETGLNLFEWQSELIYNECRTRHPDLYSAALNDAEMMIASRTSSLDDVNISDIFRPSLMTRAEINSLLGNKTENNKHDDITVITNASYVNNPNYIFCKVSGDSMTQDGIFEDDILIVEKAPPHDGKIIVPPSTMHYLSNDIEKMIKVNGSALQMINILPFLSHPISNSTLWV